MSSIFCKNSNDDADWVPLYETPSGFSDPPTQANLNSEFGTAASVGGGYFKYVKVGVKIYYVVSDGSNWFGIEIPQLA